MASTQSGPGICAAQSPLAGGRQRRRALVCDWRRRAVGGGRRGCVMEAPGVTEPGVATQPAAPLQELPLLAPAIPEEQRERRARRRCAEGRVGKPGGPASPGG